MKRTILAITLAFSALFGFTACEKESNNKEVIEGLPVSSIKLKMSAPSDDNIVVTRASSEVETNVQNMALLFYKAGSNDKPIVIYVDKNGMGTPTKITTGTSTESTNYQYTVNLDVEGKGITTGNWYLYAIANYNTKFCNIEMDEIANLSRTDFLDYKINKANRELDIVENSVLMTGRYCESGKFGDDGSLTLEYDNKEEESCKINGVIHLRRIVAKISFEFKNGSNATTNNVTFTPETYSIYEYSRSSSLMERNDGWTTNGGVRNEKGYFGTGDFHSHEAGVSLAVVNNKIEFYMPENIQTEKSTPNSWTYAERERRTSADDRTFLYAPDHGTYIVVKGQYKDSKYSGDVTYTIHLGDFSQANGSAYNNFSIRRNYHYTYSITVNGVNNIVVEAKAEGENQPGAEGNLIGYNDESFNIRLDAHYENVLLKIKAPTGTSTINEYSVMLNTPYSKNVLITDSDQSNKDAADYDWIRFGKPASTTTFKAYKESETTDIFSFLEEIKGKALTSDGEHYIVSNGYIYTTAYVNEYYYDAKMNTASDRSAELKKFINADDRTMRIAFGTIEVSEDKQSTLTDNVVFSIQQRSIKSFFDLSQDNPFGVEQVDETPSTTSYNAKESGSETTDYNDSHYGYNNFKNAIGTSVSWNNYVNNAYLGYSGEGTSISFNSNALTDTGSYGIYQCLSRNRDENGDGKIDGDEIKWYLPAVDQCTDYWFGMNSLPSEARIKMEVNAGSVNNYFTSTSGKSAWWADEGSSYGGYSKKESSVRCIRSLKNYSGETSDLSSFNKDEQTIYIKGLDDKSIRESFTVESEYSEHFRGEAQDKLPEAFKVAATNLSVTSQSGTTTTTQSTFSKSEIQTGKWCQEYYAENADKSDLGSWRIPNEKELTIMLRYTSELTNPLSTNYTCARSKYERPNSEGTMIYYINSRSVITTDTNDNTGTTPISNRQIFTIRCVRDATPDSSGSDETDKGSNTFESGGNVIK